VIIPLECTGWTAADAIPDAYADFDDGKRLTASGVHPGMGSGEKLAALMECFAGVRPWKEHLELASNLITQYRFVSGPPDDRLELLDGPPDLLLKSLMRREIESIRFGSHTLTGRAAQRELVKWHFRELDFRARAFARAQASFAYLTTDRRAEALRASSVWTAVTQARLEAAAWLSAWSDEFSAGRAGFVQADVPPPAIQLEFTLESPDGWSATEIDDLTDRFMNSLAMQRRFLTYAHDRPEPVRSPAVEEVDTSLPEIDGGGAPNPHHV
jgi:hypothetical protein